MELKRILVLKYIEKNLWNLYFTGAHAFSRKHPLSCWLSTMLVVFASGMLCNGLLGEPILAPLKNTPQVVVATIVWSVENIKTKFKKFL